ncbi:hypothetical protein [secondary endosymbiont of Heteropsylla cubana]|nr:hypothetical protein [secondary endosymbiont of Heteropsylla cubana]
MISILVLKRWQFVPKFANSPEQTLVIPLQINNGYKGSVTKTS